MPASPNHRRSSLRSVLPPASRRAILGFCTTLVGWGLLFASGSVSALAQQALGGHSSGNPPVADIGRESQWYIDWDTGKIYLKSSGQWSASGTITNYILPPATTTTLGGVITDPAGSITNAGGTISVTYGTGASTAAVGNDSRITGALQTSSLGTNVSTALGTSLNTSGGLLSQSGALSASAILLGGGSGSPVTSTATGSGVISAIANNVNTAGGLIESTAAWSANALVIGGGSGASPSTTTTGTGVLTAIASAVNTSAGLVTQSGTLTSSALLLGGGSGSAITSTTTGTGIVSALGNATNAASGLVALNASTYIPSLPQVGVSTNSNAAAGNIGEYISSDIPTGSAVSLAVSGTTYNLTSVSLTAGDWDCRGNVSINTAATTVVNNVFGAISTTSATIPAAPETGGQFGIYPFNSPNPFPAENTSTVRELLSGTTTIYLVVKANFTTSTASAYGLLGCRRMR